MIVNFYPYNNPIPSLKGDLFPTQGYILDPKDQAFTPLVYHNTSEGEIAELANLFVSKTGIPVELKEMIAVNKGGQIISRDVGFFDLANEDEVLEEILNRMDKVGVSKAFDPLDVKSLARFTRRLENKLHKVVDPLEKMAIDDALDILKSKEFLASSTTSGFNKAVKKLGKIYPSVLTVKAMDEINAILDVDGQRVISATKKNLKKIPVLSGIDQAFNVRDEKALDAYRKSTAHFMTDSYGKRAIDFEDKASVIVKKGVDKGLDSKTLGGKLFNEFGSKMNRSQSYYDVVANAWTVRSRSIGQLNSYLDGGVEYLKITSVIDEVTTEQCRWLDGKLLPVGVIAEKQQDVENLSNLDDFKDKSPWLQTKVLRNEDGSVQRDERGNSIKEIGYKKKDKFIPTARIVNPGIGTQSKGSYRSLVSDRGIADAGLGLPPYHGKCRSSTDIP